MKLTPKFLPGDTVVVRHQKSESLITTIDYVLTQEGKYLYYLNGWTNSFNESDLVSYKEWVTSNK